MKLFFKKKNAGEKSDKENRSKWGNCLKHNISCPGESEEKTGLREREKREGKSLERRDGSCPIIPEPECHHA